MAFHEVRFPTALSFGSAGGPERRAEVVTLANGYEERNTPWAQSRHRYDAGMGMCSLDDLSELIAFFEARQGQLHGFRWKDWTDFKSCVASAVPGAQDQVLGSGNGSETAFQLVKSYQSGGAAYARQIVKPVAGTVVVAVDGAIQAEGAAYAVDTATGVVSFVVPPADGAQVTAGFEFDVPVRFDTDRIAMSMASFQAGDVPSVPIVEVRV
ncbi:MAG: DUF2460 domain-containing protein [Pseudomonadota bacterium]